MKNYIQTSELSKMFNISRENLYYWIKNNKISQPIKNSTNHYLWEQKHIEEIECVLKNKETKSILTKNSIETFELNNRRYLGNKFKLIPFIKKIVKTNCGEIDSIFDVFSGTGVVADAFKECKIITNDILYSNYVNHYAFFSNEKFDKIKLLSYIEHWNSISSIKEDNYVSINFGNKYFSIEVCKKIGYIRDEIEKLYNLNEINKREKYILLTSLLFAMDKIANTCGHYDAYRKSLNFDNNFIMKFPNIKKVKSNNEIYNTDSNNLASTIIADLAYIDPPYNSRQYSDAYHLLENIAKWEKPEVYGVACKMDRTNIKSDYCTIKAPIAFKELINNLNVKYILVSYNNMSDKGNDRSNAKITDTQIIDILKTRGNVKVFEKSYKPFSTGKSNIKDNKERLFLCEVNKFNNDNIENKKIASPLNYTGGKYKLLSQIEPIFPKNIPNMIDLFSGGCNVGINSNCKNVKFIDKQQNLIRLFNCFKYNSIDYIFNTINNIIQTYELSKSDENGYDYYDCNSSNGLAKYNKDKYLKLREDFNNRTKDNYYTDLVFYVLIIYGFNNQIRFNKDNKFNLPVGKRDFNNKMKEKLYFFINKIQNNNYEFIYQDFLDIQPKLIDKNTFIYADPPYLIANATYNEQDGWNEYYENNLLIFLNKIDEFNINFALSNVIENKGKKNNMLSDWILENKKRYRVHYLEYNYSNSNYHTKDKSKDSTIEILVTNY